ncbi:MAG TPA: YitT family protein [Bacteroidales bacterium]|nr:YitT family protein [Bacteroidales bacterium]HPS16697.1 YitT family protein [Bacteroidales bacterium]
MAYLQKDKPFSKKWFLSYSLIIIGAFTLAVGYVYFISPHKIVPGGVFGISIVLHHVFGFPIGITGLILNVPLTIIGIKILGPRFGVKTVVGFSLASIFIDTLTMIWGEAPLVKEDVLLSAIFGGVLVGLGVGLIFKGKATSGGSDIVAMIIAKYTRMPLGQLMIIIDSCIVIVGLIAFGDWRIPLYSWIVIFITGKVIDTVLEGISYDKTLFIVTEKYEELREKIIKDLDRGGTLLHGEGMYKGTEKKVIFTNVNRRELAMLQEYINSIDPNAFMSVIDANEIIGNGFKSLREKVEQ